MLHKQVIPNTVTQHLKTAFDKNKEAETETIPTTKKTGHIFLLKQYSAFTTIG